MRLCRFFQSGDLTVNTALRLDKEVSSHIHRVLRLKIDEEIQLFNGDGLNYQAKIVTLGSTVMVDILEATATNVESPLKIHLGQAISKGERMDYTLQKSVELGVNCITPIISERVQFRLDEKRLQRKIEHWQKVIASAAEQSGRTKLPNLNTPITLQKWLTMDNTQGLLFIPNTEKRLKDLHHLSTVRLLIGPEGGFSEDEINLVLSTSAFTAINLGPRILRTETAALTAISILQSQCGDI